MIKRLSAVAALAVGATCLFAPTATQAAEANQCWTRIDTGESRCFTTFAAVVADLSGGKVKVSGGPSSFSTADASALAAVAASSVTAAIVYEAASYGGASNTYLASSACDSNPDVDHQAGLSGSSWDNRISSFKSYNNCQTTLWTGYTYNGSSYGPQTNSINVGATVNDQGSSMQWS